MQQNILEMLTCEQFLECRRLNQIYGIGTAFNYAIVVTSKKYRIALLAHRPELVIGQSDANKVS